MTLENFIEISNCSQRLENILSMEYFKYMTIEAVTFGYFMKVRNAGVASWKEFTDLRKKFA